MLNLRAVVVAALLVVGVSNVSNGARILGVFPFPAPSHQIVMTSLMKELAAKGHEVTVISPYAQPKPLKNYREIIIGTSAEEIRGGSDKEIDIYAERDMPTLVSMFLLWGFGIKVCTSTLTKPTIQQFIKSTDEKFDLVIVEDFFNECFLGFAHKFQAPVVQICPFGGTEWMGDAVGNPHNYAYMPDFNLNYSDHMSFLQRLHNTIVGLTMKIGRAVYYMPKQNSIMHTFFDGVIDKPVPHISTIDSSTSLVLLNNHVSLTNPKPFLPNIVEVGGMHIKPPKKLPQDLQEFLDSATEGVVYFSMGSNLRSADMPVEKRDALLQAFGKLKQKVLWKWEEDVLPGQPKNVKLSKWLPQSDLLAHPNIKMFITHGGLLSTQEAMYNGVPVVGIPIFGDQQMNMKKAVLAGYGYLLDFHSITSSESVSEAIGAVLNNPKYRENAQRISRIFRDQPRTPLETAVFWTEYVIRHKGAYHLRSAAMDLTWCQYYLLDVIAVLGGAALLALLAAYFTLRTICRCICSNKKTQPGEESKKKK